MASSQDIQTALERFSDLPDGEDLDIADGLIVRKTSVDRVTPDLSSDLVGERWPALAALEYLAFTVGSLVLDEACAPLRSYVQGGELSDEIGVERLLDRKYEPAHAMYWSQSEASLDFYVQLFRAVVFRVRLKPIRIKSSFPGIHRTTRHGEEPVVKQWPRGALLCPEPVASHLPRPPPKPEGGGVCPSLSPNPQGV